MAKATIRCAAPPGFDGLFRAGRKWAASGVDVELLDGADDAPDVEGVPQIGTRSLAAIHADTRFSVNEVGSHRTVLELKARVAELEAVAKTFDDAYGSVRDELTDARARVAELQTELASFKAENAKLKAELAAKASTPADAAPAPSTATLPPAPITGDADKTASKKGAAK